MSARKYLIKVNKTLWMNGKLIV